MNIIPVILAGGTGKRLWPLSRELHPKQFLPITSDKSLLQETVLRFSGKKNVADPIVVCNEEHRFLVAEQIREISSKAEILLEPIGRNTAPAVCAAAWCALEKYKDDSLLLIQPTDHVIDNKKVVPEILGVGVKAASEGEFVIFGIKPRKADSGYGYISYEKSAGNSVKGVKAFKEKPSIEQAEVLVDNGALWNTGIFLVKASVYLSLIEKFEPNILKLCKKAFETSKKDFDFTRLDKKSFTSCKATSIDYALLEKLNEPVVIELESGWHDLNSWSSLWNVLPKDSNGNVSKGDVLLKSTSDSMVIASRRQVCTIGVKDLVIIETDTSILVANKSDVERVKELTEQLKNDGRSEVKLHRQVCRPWGKFDSIDKGERFQVKHITVNPGEKLSKQMHYHRAEHWVVVSGTAKVTNGDDELILTENQSTYIPVGVVHALENPGNAPLDIIEVQSGSYLGEDDIVRFEDRYGRE